MNVAELYSALDGIIPASLRCEWDNDGVMCCPDPDREAKKALVALDVTESTAEAAVKGGYDVVVTHHPMIFRPLRGITDPVHVRLVKAGVSVFSFHTRFDALPGGVNDALAAALGLTVTGRGVSEGIGVICRGGGECFADFAERAKRALGAPFAEYADGGRTCGKIALLGGDCDHTAAFSALALGCDTLLAGSVGYNTMLDCARAGMNVVAAGHYYTEAPCLDVLAEMIKGVSPGTSADVLRETRVRVLK